MRLASLEASFEACIQRTINSGFRLVSDFRACSLVASRRAEVEKARRAMMDAIVEVIMAAGVLEVELRKLGEFVML